MNLPNRHRSLVSPGHVLGLLFLGITGCGAATDLGLSGEAIALPDERGLQEWQMIRTESGSRRPFSPQALDAMHSVRENRIVAMDQPATIAEGLRTTLGDVTLPILREHLAGFYTVEEGEIVQALRFAFERLKMVIEPSAAVALAPLLRREPALAGKKVGVILTGGNVDLSSYFEGIHAAPP